MNQLKEFEVIYQAMSRPVAGTMTLGKRTADTADVAGAPANANMEREEEEDYEDLEAAVERDILEVDVHAQIQNVGDDMEL